MPHPGADAGGSARTRSASCSAGRTSIFVLVVFAYPIVFAVWMSFQDYFFAAPGAVVDRPFVGFANYVAVLQDPKVWQSFGNVGIFLLINVPLTVVFSLLLAYGLEHDRARRHLLPHQLLRALRHRVGGGRGRVVVPLQP